RAEAAFEADELVARLDVVVAGVRVGVDLPFETVDRREPAAERLLAPDTDARSVASELDPFAGRLVGVLQSDVQPAVEIDFRRHQAGREEQGDRTQPAQRGGTGVRLRRAPGRVRSHSISRRKRSATPAGSGM